MGGLRTLFFIDLILFIELECERAWLILGYLGCENCLYINLIYWVRECVWLTVCDSACACLWDE